MSLPVYKQAALKPGLFTIIEGSAIVLLSNGVYRQAKAYKRNGLIYAQYGSGYVRLNSSGGTTAPKLVIEGAELPDGFGYTQSGYMCEANFKDKHYDESGEKCK